jgi:hypothetical protein
VTGTDTRTSKSFAIGENIYGPFENGFAAAQDNILAKLGCTAGKGYVSGGIDTLTAEAMVAQDCGVVLPRIEGSNYISLLDECGGHTAVYHFHERLSCLYNQDGSGIHSTQLGKGMVPDQFLYGRFEDEANDKEPLLDACGGHYGRTPESPDVDVYHYHVQDKPPFTFGCYGPNADDTLVTLAQCRALHSKDCGDGDEITVTVAANEIMGYTAEQQIVYDPWCPCFDGEGSNTGLIELAVFDDGSPSAPSPSAPSPIVNDTADFPDEDGAAGREVVSFRAVLTVLGAVIAGAF